MKDDKKKRKVFDDTETISLLRLWASKKIQNQFHCTTRHNLIYESLSRQMKEQGFTASAAEIKNKLKNLKTEYKNKKPKSGSSPPDWPYFDILHQVLGQRDAQNDDLLDESIDNDYKNFYEADIHPNSDSDTHTVNHTNKNKKHAQQYEESQCNTDDLNEDNEVPHIQKDNEKNMDEPSKQLPQNAKELCTIIKRRRRPRPQLREDKLMDALINTEQAFQKRLDAMQQLEDRREQRDEVVAQSMTRFLTAFANLAENNMNEGRAIPFPVPRDAIDTHEKNAATSVIYTQKCKPVENRVTNKKSNNDSKTFTKIETYDQQITNVTESMKSSASEVEEEHASCENEYTDIHSNVEFLDDEIDNLPPFRQLIDYQSNEENIDPIAQYLKEVDNNVSSKNKCSKAKKPKIISYKILHEPYKIETKSRSCAATTIQLEPSKRTVFPAKTYLKRKSDNITISK